MVMDMQAKTKARVARMDAKRATIAEQTAATAPEAAPEAIEEKPTKKKKTKTTE